MHPYRDPQATIVQPFQWSLLSPEQEELQDMYAEIDRRVFSRTLHENEDPSDFRDQSDFRRDLLTSDGTRFNRRTSRMHPYKPSDN